VEGWREYAKPQTVLVHLRLSFSARGSKTLQLLLRSEVLFTQRVDGTLLIVYPAQFFRLQDAACKKTRKSREPILQCRRAGQVGHTLGHNRGTPLLTTDTRKTGIRLEDKGVRDEYGMEPVSGIFSSPEKSPPKRGASARRTGGTVTDSESMDIQEST
jgi:hypothetical protein